METINVQVSDQTIFNKNITYAKIAHTIAENKDFIIDLGAEGPDFSTLSIHEYIQHLCEEFNYDSKRIILRTSNICEDNANYKLKIEPNDELSKMTVAFYQYNFNKETNLKHFGLFVNRATPYRNALSSYINKHYPTKSFHSNHFLKGDESYDWCLNLEKTYNDFTYDEFIEIINYLKECPIEIEITDKLTQNERYCTIFECPGSRLLEKDYNQFLKNYNSLFVDIVCESYVEGKNFFPTEKTWRPILLKTPFIVHGPKDYLKNLKKMGFKTFDRWWDEGYDLDYPVWKIKEIKKLIDFIGNKTQDELNIMLKEMQPILDHNYNLLLNLKMSDYMKVLNE